MRIILIRWWWKLLPPGLAEGRIGFKVVTELSSLQLCIGSELADSFVRQIVLLTHDFAGQT